MALPALNKSINPLQRAVNGAVKGVGRVVNPFSSINSSASKESNDLVNQVFVYPVIWTTGLIAAFSLIQTVAGKQINAFIDGFLDFCLSFCHSEEKHSEILKA